MSEIGRPVREWEIEEPSIVPERSPQREEEPQREKETTPKREREEQPA